MKLLAINGSPRREKGNTQKLLASVLASAQSAGHTTKIMYLADENPEPCEHCGHSCFTDGRCAREPKATLRSEAIQQAEGLILGAPVYCWQPNSLTCALFDKFRIPNGTWVDSSEPGIPALGIAVAGGTGTGVFTALQSMYAWFCAWRFTPLHPVPVTRYNIDQVVADSGNIAGLFKPREDSVFTQKWDHMLLYDRLPFMSYGRVDEFEWLAREMAAFLERNGGNGQVLNEINSLLDRGGNAHRKGEEAETAQCYLSAFDAAYPHCR